MKSETSGRGQKGGAPSSPVEEISVYPQDVNTARAPLFPYLKWPVTSHDNKEKI